MTAKKNENKNKKQTNKKTDRPLGHLDYEGFEFL